MNWDLPPNFVHFAELHYLPATNMHPRAKFPGWKHRPEPWFYQKVRRGKVFSFDARTDDHTPVHNGHATALPGGVMLVDIRKKEEMVFGDECFTEDEYIGSIIRSLRKKGRILTNAHAPVESRLGVNPWEWDGQIKPALLDAFAKDFRLNIERLRIEKVMEWNVIPQLYPSMPRVKDGMSVTWHDDLIKKERGNVVKFSSVVTGYSRLNKWENVDHSFFESVIPPEENYWFYRSFRPIATVLPAEQELKEK